MNINIYLWSYLAQLSLDCELFQTNIVEQIKTYFRVQYFIFSKIMR
jgi:hypothetical protein